MSSDPQNFGKYQIQSRLGQGGMSTVYVARDPDLGREVAIKVLSSHLTADPQFAERFMREAKAMAQLEHPAILPVYDFGQQEGTLFLVMRLLSGGTLAQRLRGEPERDSQLDAVLSPIAEALDFAHSQGVLHRDVKPANIGFDDRGRPYLMDFGLAYLAQQGAALTQTGAMLGTPNYMAPEQAEGKPPTNATDIYALGVVAYEMLTGHAPFVGDTVVATMLLHITAPPPSIKAVRPEIPQAADDVLQKVLAKDPKERYTTAREFMEALLTALDATRVIPPKTWRPATSPAIDQPRPSVPTVPATEVLVPAPARKKPGLGDRLREALQGLFRPGPDAGEQAPPSPAATTIVWPEPADHVPGMETVVISGPTLSDTLLQRGSPSLVLDPAVADLLAPVGRSTIRDLLSHQEPERIVNYIVTYGGGRFLIAGYGSFGGTSLTKEICRLAWHELTPRLAAQRGCLLVARLALRESLTESAPAWEATVQNPPAEPLPIGLFATAPTDGAKADQPLSLLLDTLADQMGPRQLRTPLVAQISEAIPSQARLSHLILVVDKVQRPATLDAFLTHPLAAIQGVTLLVLAEQEQLNRWPDQVRDYLKARWKFQMWPVPSLWEGDYHFVDRTMNRLVSGFRMDTPGADTAYDAFKKHLAYVGRGQLGTTLYELRQWRYWQSDRATGQAFIALDALDDPLIEHHASVQDLLEQHWDEILGSYFAGREQIDRAKQGVYSLMDWIIDAAAFTMDELLEEAERRPVIIASQKRKRDDVVRRLLPLLVANDYLHRHQNSYDVIWSRDIAPDDGQPGPRSTRAHKLVLLEARLEALHVDLEAANRQWSKALDEVERTRVQRTMDDLEAEIAKVEAEIASL